MKVAIVRAALAAALLAAPFAAAAHPHMSLKSSCEFVWKGAALTGAYIDWAFDPYFSADIIRGYDSNGDGIFDKKETAAVYGSAFQNLKNYHYFTFIRQGEARTNPETVSDFSVYQKSGTLHYRFLVDLARYRGELSLAIYDYTYYCAIDYAKEGPFSFNLDPALVEAEATIEENRKYPVYYNPKGAIDDTTVYYKKKEGLLTIYPKEIRLRYAAPKE